MVGDELGRVRRDLAEDLVNIMEMVKEHCWEEQPEKMRDMTEEERDAFWTAEEEQQREWLDERRRELSTEALEASRRVSETQSHLHLLVPADLRALADELADLSSPPYYGTGYKRKKQRDEARERLIEAVRADLRVEPTPPH